jgi:hypothetical protein
MRLYPVLRVFLAVTAGAMFGLVLGGLFGRWAGGIAPHFFTEAITTKNAATPIDPVGMGTVLGATAGVLCGGGLAAFAYVVHITLEWIAAKKSSTPSV